MLARPKELGLTPAEPFHAGVVEQPYPSPLDTDMHQAFEAGVLLSGAEDRHFEDLVIPVTPGGVWLCAAWEPHGWRATAPDTRELVMQFLPEFLGEEMFDGLSWLSLFSVPPPQRPRVTTSGIREMALEIAQDIRREMQERRRAWLASVRLSILRLLLAVSREWQPKDQSGRQRRVRTGSLAKVMPAVRLVHSNPARRLAVAEAAAACGLSVSQFGYTFRHAMGLSFGKFCMRTRLAYVAQLLLSTDFPVEAIAEEAGFADASHVHHAFAKVYRCTPARYRSEGQRPRLTARYALIESSTPDDPELQQAPGTPLHVASRASRQPRASE